MSRRPILFLAPSLVLVALPAVAMRLPAADARTTAPAHKCATGASDFDGNGGVDLVVSAPENGADGDARPPAAAADYFSRGPGAIRVLMRHRHGMRSVSISAPRRIKGNPVRSFGDAIAELDLSPHRKASQPCADLAVSASYRSSHGARSAIVLYRWLRSAHRFGVLRTLTAHDLGFGLTAFGSALASQTMHTDRPAPRKPVLYVSATQPHRHGAVVRLILSPRGTVVSKQLIAPGAKPTANVPISTAKAYTGFGDELLGTPDPNQVIIGDETALTSRGDGAVLVWNRGRKSQLITPKSVGLPWPAFSDTSWFGFGLFLTTEAADVTGGKTSLLIGAPEYSLPDAEYGGVAVQLRYDRSTKPARVITAHSKVWSQDSKGVAGRSDDDDDFGWSFGALVQGKRTVVLTSAPYERDKRGVGVVDALGTGQVWRASSFGQKQGLSRTSQGFGSPLSSAHDINDWLAHDPFPRTPARTWANRTVVATPSDDWISIGLPTKTSRHFTIYRFRGRNCPSDIGCGFGSAMTSSLGG